MPAMDAPSRQTPPNPQVIPYASPVAVPGAAPALTAEHLAQITAARKLGARLSRAAGVAKFDGWTIGIFGAITLLSSIGSILGMVLGTGMAVLAFFQLKAADRLSQLDETAPGLLARNQIILGALLFIYGSISLWMAINNAAPLSSSSSEMGPEIAQMLAPYEKMAQVMYEAVYVGVMALAIVGPGLTALYYYRQRKNIAAYRSSTPAWLISLQQAGVKL